MNVARSVLFMNVQLPECGATKHMIIVGAFLQYLLQMTYIYYSLRWELLIQ